MSTIPKDRIPVVAGAASRVFKDLVTRPIEELREIWDEVHAHPTNPKPPSTEDILALRSYLLNETDSEADCTKGVETLDKLSLWLDSQIFPNPIA